MTEITSPKIYVSQLKIHNHTVGLKPDSIVCVVGANSSGKSSLLENINGRAKGVKGVLRRSALNELDLGVSISEAEVQGTLDRLSYLNPGDEMVVFHGGKMSSRQKY